MEKKKVKKARTKGVKTHALSTRRRLALKGLDPNKDYRHVSKSDDKVGFREMDGWEVLKRLREISDCPVIMLTVFGSTEDIIQGLELGADDYLVKPFGVQELIARVSAVLRRANTVQ